jgi:hypothetical protein
VIPDSVSVSVAGMQHPQLNRTAVSLGVTAHANDAGAHEDTMAGKAK